MVVLITGASHTGKTALAQKLLEKYHFPYLSLDHLKMGLIRSGNTPLTPDDDEELTSYLWPIAREIIKTAIENDQNLIIEGCYIPFDWQTDFPESYLKDIRFICLVMSRAYLEQNFESIKKYANVIEHRKDDGCCTLKNILADNAKYLEMCERHRLRYILIDDKYDFGKNVRL